MAGLYAIMAVISMVLRRLYLPDPFECFGAAAWLYNLIAEPIIHVVAFAMVGLVYHKGDCPALGSFLYLVAYAAIVGILALMGIFSFAWWWNAIIVAAMIGIGIMLAKLGRWLSGETW